MQTVRKNVKRLLYFFLVLILIALLFEKWGVILLLFVIVNWKPISIIGGTALVAAAIYFFVKLKVRLRTRIIIILLIPVVGYASACLFSFTFPTNYGRCDFYNQPDTLDGGVKIINGVSYRFQMCGTGGNDQDGTDDKIELKVFSESGELLARRHFSVNWYAGGSFHEPLKYGKNFVSYIDVSDESGFDKRLSIPPSKWDWIRARLPLF